MGGVKGKGGRMVVYTVLSGILLSVLFGCAPSHVREYNRGISSLLKKDFELAELHFQRAVEVEPEFGEAWLNLGYARKHLAKRLRQAGEEELALQKEEGMRLAYRRALELFRRGDTLLLHGKEKRQEWIDFLRSQLQ